MTTRLYKYSADCSGHGASALGLSSILEHCGPAGSLQKSPSGLNLRGLLVVTCADVPIERGLTYCAAPAITFLVSTIASDLALSPHWRSSDLRPAMLPIRTT